LEAILIYQFFLSACGDFLDLSSWEYQMQKSSEIIEGAIGEIPLGLKRESPRGDPLELLVEIYTPAECEVEDMVNEGGCSLVLE
jgi:hypothetical protein